MRAVCIHMLGLYACKVYSHVTFVCLQGVFTCYVCFLKQITVAALIISKTY